GIKVDECGRTSDPSIFAIGDCAQYPHGVSAYVMPIMAAARAIAPGALGNPTPIKFPALSVQVKTTLLPINLLPAARGAQGAWKTAETGTSGGKHLFEDDAGRLLGYVLTRDKCEERTQLDARLLAGQELGDAA